VPAGVAALLERVLARPQTRPAVVGATAGAIGLLPLLVHRPSVLSELPLLPIWLLAALFAVTDLPAIRIRFGDQAQPVTIVAIPLVMGLFLAEPRDAALARLLAGAVVLAVVRRQRPTTTALNLALALGVTAVALVGFRFMLGAGEPLGARNWGAAVIATVAAGLAEVAARTGLARWRGEPARGSPALLVLLTGVLGPVMVALMGVVAVLALNQGAAALPLAVTGGAVLLGYRAFATLSERHASLEQLFQLSEALAAEPAANDVASSVLLQSRELLAVRYAELLLHTGDGRALRWSCRAAGEVSGPAEVGQAAARAAPGRRGRGERLVVPLRVDQEVAGHLLVAVPSGEGSRFRPEDRRLLETIANHASLALRNGRLIDRLNHEARHDELTGLPNRLHFRSLLDVAARDAASGGVPCAVMVLDFDGFKAINDTLGHQAGDDLLCVLAARLRAAAAATDALVARLGGDEFAVISTAHAAPEEAQSLAEHLLTVFDEPVEVAGTRLRLGGSLGIALGPRHGETGSDLLRHADIAMYAAKSSSASVRMFSPDLVEVSAGSLTLATDLRDALARDEIHVAVQPLIELASGRVHSVEVLARWRHPELGEIGPAEFFAAAERSGQVAALSARILDRALALCRRSQASGRPIRVAVNVAARMLADPSLPEQIALALARRAVPADLLCLEITETSVIADPGRAVETLTRLRRMGVHLSVDDFGTGYSSLTYLSRLPVHQMKIDKSFVHRLRESPTDRAIAQSILDLGRNLGLEVVAEGITDQETLEALQGMGCTLGQGFLYGRPMGEHDLQALLDRGALQEVPVGRGHQPRRTPAVLTQRRPESP
jgi:diguanylate cyclase (GGDEF)-like protein